MVEATEDPRDSTMIITLFDCGMRASEFLGLRIRDVEDNDDHMILHIPKSVSKTYSRPVPIVRAVPYLKRYLMIHPDKDNPNAMLWVSRFNESIKSQMLNNILRLARNKSGIDKHITAHLLRHSRAFEVKANKEMNEEEMRMFFGWSKYSNMPSYYGQLDNEQVRKSVLKAHGVGEKEILTKDIFTPKTCPRCSVINPPTNSNCYECYTPMKENYEPTESEIFARRFMRVLKKLDNKEFSKALVSMLDSVEHSLSIRNEKPQNSH
jgi:hypothetical protein